MKTYKLETLKNEDYVVPCDLTSYKGKFQEEIRNLIIKKYGNIPFIIDVSQSSSIMLHATITVPKSNQEISNLNFEINKDNRLSKLFVTDSYYARKFNLDKLVEKSSLVDKCTFSFGYPSVEYQGDTEKERMIIKGFPKNFIEIIELQTTGFFNNLDNSFINLLETDKIGLKTEYYYDEIIHKDWNTLLKLKLKDSENDINYNDVLAKKYKIILFRAGFRRNFKTSLNVGKQIKTLLGPAPLITDFTPDGVPYRYIYTGEYISKKINESKTNIKTKRNIKQFKKSIKL